MRQGEGEHKRESDDVTQYNIMTLIKGVHTNTHTQVEQVYMFSYTTVN